MLKCINGFLVTIFLCFFSTQSWALEWKEIVAKAKGQTVYFNAWGGSEDINAYIDWVRREVKSQYDIELKHVLVDDTAVPVSRILTEQQNKTAQSSIDLIWINGENFRTLKENKALLKDVNPTLPNYGFVNTKTLPTTTDFTVAVDNLEVPWGVAQLVFIYDDIVMTKPPMSTTELIEYATQNPGRVSYPRPPQFHGSSFLKQVLIELSNQSEALFGPVEEADFESITAPLWDYLDELHPVAWRRGRAFPKDASHMLQLLNDGELDIAFTFNPQEVATAIKKGALPQSAKRYAMDIGALTNVHFVAIPNHSVNKEAARVVANFLIAPQAQARKASTDYWGDPTVLDMAALSEDNRALFNEEYRLYDGLSEPHPSWQVKLEEEWARRYSQ